MERWFMDESLPPFRDRKAAGRVLANKLMGFAGAPDLVVLALPRGGVPVAYEVARGLGAPLDVFVVRKLGVPGHEELAMGAIASGGARVLNDDVLSALGISEHVVDIVASIEARELARRERAYRGGRPPLDVRGSTVIVVDDGLATGSTMRAAILALRARGPARIIAAAPVAAAPVCERLKADADVVVCAVIPERFQAVGIWYEDFSQTSDEEVRALLESARSAPVYSERSSAAAAAR